MAGIEDLLKLQQSELFSPVDRLDAPKFDPAANRRKLAANPLFQFINPMKKIKLAGAAAKGAANYLAPNLVETASKSLPKLVDRADDFYKNILSTLSKNEGSYEKAGRELGLSKTGVKNYEREAINRGLFSDLDASSEYTATQLKNIPVKPAIGKADKKIKDFALVQQRDGTIVPDTYFVKSSGTGTTVNINKDPVLQKIFKDETNLNKFLNYLKEYPDTAQISKNKTGLKKQIADDLGLPVNDLFGISGSLRNTKFNRAKIIAQNLPKYDTTPSIEKRFLSLYKVQTKKTKSRTATAESWKGLTTDQIKYYVNNSGTKTIKEISDSLEVKEPLLNNLKDVLLKAQKDNPYAFGEIIGKYNRKIYSGDPTRSRSRFSNTLAPRARDVVSDIEKAGFKNKKIQIGDKTESLIPEQLNPQPRLHEQGASLAGSQSKIGKYGLVYDEAQEAQQGWNILFEPKTKKLKAGQTSTQSANVQQNTFEKNLVKLMDKRQNLISEGNKIGFSNKSALTDIVPKDKNKTIFELLKDNQNSLDDINKGMEKIGVRTLMRIRQPDGTFKTKQFGEVLSGMSDFVKKRKADLLQKGGRVGFKKNGGMIVDTYSDGTKLNKINSYLKGLS